MDILEHGSIEGLAVEHPDPEKVVLAMKLQERYPQDPESLGGVYGVCERAVEFYPEVTDEMLGPQPVTRSISRSCVSSASRPRSSCR